MIRPETYCRRMPTYRLHEGMGAKFEAIGDIAAIHDYGDADFEAAAVRSLALVDLTALPRCGFKNEGAPEWLARNGVSIPDRANRATRQERGGLCLRLGGTDILVIASPYGDDLGPNELRAKWTAEKVKPCGWNAYREEGFNWFTLVGEQAPEFWSRVCAVDMRPSAFPDLEVAQTRAFHMGGVIVRADISGVLAYNLFFDIASSDFLIDVAQETLRELGGVMVGLSALRSLR